MEQLEVLALGSALVEMTPVRPGADLTGGDQYQALPSGAAANFCIALARLGCRVALATRVGDDELGRWLLGALTSHGVDVSSARAVAGQLTPVSFGWMTGSGAKTFYFYRFPGYSDPMGSFGDLPLSDAELTRARLLDFTEATIRSEPLRSQSLALARRARDLGLQVCYAANYRAGSWHETPERIAEVQREALGLAHIAVMNREELRLITGHDRVSPDLVGELGPALIAVTNGAEGAWIVTADRSCHVEALPVKVCYDIGAGDTFHAGLVAALLRGLTGTEAGHIAAAAAALRISRAADMASLPTWAECVAVVAGEALPAAGTCPAQKDVPPS